MRMWCVPPIILCRNHLLGEHNELHKLLGCLRLGKSIKGYLNNKFVCPMQMKKRHDQLMEEMLRRGYNHRSPLQYDGRKFVIIIDRIQKLQNLKELIHRCPRCRENLRKALEEKDENRRFN